MRITPAIVVLFCVMSLTASAQDSPSPRPHRVNGHYAPKASIAHHAAKADLKVGPVENQGPMLPEPASTLPPEVPEVVVAYQQGKLAINAEDAPLGEVLAKVSESTGAPVEGPTLQQRVTVHLKAQDPIQAIAALLDGQHIDYAILGGTSVNDPVRRIVLTPRLPVGGGPAVPSAYPAMDASAIQPRSPAVIRQQETGGDDVWNPGSTPTSPHALPRPASRRHN